jgi:hypothetical protein
MMRIVGSDKIGIISLIKHGSHSLIPLSNDNDFINVPMAESIDSLLSDENYILLFPWRDEFESIKSGFMEDMRELVSILKKEDMHILFRFMFDKKSNLPLFNIGHGHKHLLFGASSIDNILLESDILLGDWKGCKFYFFDLKHLSNPKLIEWISEHDPRWKDISIGIENSIEQDPFKTFIIKTLSEVGDELDIEYNDINNIENWPGFEHYYSFSKRFFDALKHSKYFLNFDTKEYREK